MTSLPVAVGFLQPHLLMTRPINKNNRISVKQLYLISIHRVYEGAVFYKTHYINDYNSSERAQKTC